MKRNWSIIPSKTRSVSYNDDIHANREYNGQGLEHWYIKRSSSRQAPCAQANSKPSANNSLQVKKWRSYQDYESWQWLTALEKNLGIKVEERDGHTLTEYKTATSPISSPSFQSLGSETTIRANAADKMVLKKNR